MSTAFAALLWALAISIGLFALLFVGCFVAMVVIAVRGDR